MHIAEIRFLEGPNLFLLRPAVKIEVVAAENDRTSLAIGLDHATGSRTGDLAAAWRTFVERAHEAAGLRFEETTVVALDEPDHVGLIFGWSHRPGATAIAELVRSLVSGDPLVVSSRSSNLRQAATEPADGPEWIRDADRSIPSIAVTGTNGKTTTTRLLAHIARAAGMHVGWSSSSGVYVDGELIEGGDYSGPSGASQVLSHKGLDLAILETARGGILLKGLGYESNDVSVFTNLSGDHLGLHGVLTVETLARVKAVVCRVTRAGGVAVLNADDDQVMGAAVDLRADRCLVSRVVGNPLVTEYAASGGRVVVKVDGRIEARTGDVTTFQVDVTDIPMCHGGRAVHQVENAMSAIGAALAAGLPVEALRDGLRSFGSAPDHNPGRLNVYEMDGHTVVLDYAHNEAGLERLLTFGRELAEGRGRVIAVIGSAGDREPALLRALGRVAAEKSDHVIAKGTQRYLRGIEGTELMRLYREGASAFPETPYDEVADEWAAVGRINEIARPGDVFVLMFQEILGEVEALLKAPKPA